MNNKICVYTCITGNYDNVIEFPNLKEKNIDYYLFTNNKNIISNFWNVIYIENEGLDNIRLARKIKILGHESLSKYDITVWIDGSSYPKKKISEFINKHCNLKKYDLIGFKHPTNDCIYDEAKSCIIYAKDDKDTIIKQINYLKSQNYPEHNGLIESAILVRNNKSSKLKETMNNWFDMVKKYSYRDQLSFNYAAYLSKLKMLLLNMKAFENDYFGRNKHIIKERLKKYRIYFGEYENLDEYDYNNDFTDLYKSENDYYVIEKTAPCNGNVIDVRIDNIGGIFIEDIKIKGKKNIKTIFKNHVIYKNNDLFLENGLACLNIVSKYKKGENIKIYIKMHTLSDIEYMEIIDNLFYKINDNNKMINELKTEVNTLKENQVKILSSKSWKITKPLRILKKY